MRYQTPNALRHDARTLAQDARTLVQATADVADEKVSAARQRISEAIERGKSIYTGVQSEVFKKAKAADEHVREHPYQSIAVALGVGVLLGLMFSRRNK